MYYKLKNGEDIVKLYSNKIAAQQVKDAYEANKNKESAIIITAITTVIGEQVARGIFLSRHLQEGGFDVRSKDMTDEDKAVFKAAVAQNTKLELLEEGMPPHFHVHLKQVLLHLNAVDLIREEVPFLVKIIPSELTAEEETWLKSTFNYRSHL